MTSSRDPRITGVDELTNPLLTLPAVDLSQMPPADNRNFLARLASRLYRRVFASSTTHIPVSLPMESNYIALDVAPERPQPNANSRSNNFNGAISEFRRPPADEPDENSAFPVSIRGENERLFISGGNQITVNPNSNESDRFKQLVLARVFNSNRRLERFEYLIVVMAILVAMGASSTFKDFGDHFVEGVEKMFGDISSQSLQEFLEWFVGLDNWMTQSCLTATSFIHVVSLWTRGLSVPSHKYLKNLSMKEKAALSVVLFTGFSSCKMAYDTLYTKYHWPLAIGVTAGALSYVSSTIINLNFFRGMVYDLKGDNNKLASVRLLKRAKDEFQILANSTVEPERFIHRLAANNLIQQLNYVNLVSSGNDTPAAQQFDNIIEELANTTKPIADTAQVKRTFNRILAISMTLGLLASFVNMKAGLQVPNFITMGALPSEENPIKFFEDLDEKDVWNWISLILGLIVFGLPSLLVNTIINTRSCENLITSAKNFWPEFRHHGLQKFNRNEKIFTAIGLTGTTGYAIGKAGSTLKYALIPNEPIPEINAAISLVVFFGLGMLSVKTFVLRARNRYSDNLMSEALSRDDVTQNGVVITGLWDYYRNLEPDQQMALRRLLLNNIITALDSMVATLNMTTDEASILAGELQRKVERKFGIKPAQARMDIEAVFESVPAADAAAVPAIVPAPDSPPMPPPLRRGLSLTASPLTRAEIERHSLYNLGFGEVFLNPGSASPNPSTLFGRSRRNGSGNNLHRLQPLESVNMDPLNLGGRSPVSSASSASSSSPSLRRSNSPR